LSTFEHAGSKDPVSNPGLKAQRDDERNGWAEIVQFHGDSGG